MLDKRRIGAQIEVLPARTLLLDAAEREFKAVPMGVFAATERDEPVHEVKAAARHVRRRAESR